MEHVKAVGGWYMEDREVTVDSAPRDGRDRGGLRPALRLLPT